MSTTKENADCNSIYFWVSLWSFSNKMMSINLDALAGQVSERIKCSDQTRFYFAMNETCK